MNRKDVAKRLGVSLSTVANLEREGRLTPQRVLVKDGERTRVRVIFEPSEVDLLAATWKPVGRTGPRKLTSHQAMTDGNMAADAFNLFGQGMKAWDVVQALRIPPETALRLWDMWKQGPDGVLRAEEEKRVLATIERERRAEEKRKSRAVWLAHQKDLALQRQAAPAPILLVRREEAAPEPPRNSERKERPNSSASRRSESPQGSESSDTDDRKGGRQGGSF